MSDTAADLGALLAGVVARLRREGKPIPERVKKPA